jgi:hypothetical protein
MTSDSNVMSSMQCRRCNVFDAMSSGVVEEFCKSETEEKPKGLLSKFFGRKKKGDNFPYIDTLKCDYSMQLVSKLSSRNSYNLVEGLKNVGFDIEQVR